MRRGLPRTVLVRAPNWIGDAVMAVFGAPIAGISLVDTDGHFGSNLLPVTGPIAQRLLAELS